MNTYQGVVMHATGWFLVLLDGWVMHTHWVAALGFVFLIYSMWGVWIKTPNEKKMKCPHCGAPTDVKDTRIANSNKVTRRRECFNGHKFKTIELYDDTQRKKAHEQGSGTGVRGLPKDGV